MRTDIVSTIKLSLDLIKRELQAPGDDFGYAAVERKADTGGLPDGHVFHVRHPMMIVKSYRSQD